MIKVSNLSKKYGDHYAVKNLSFEIEKGKVYGFLGPNGAGKSTTMNIMTGYIAASAGDVEIDGHDILKEAEEAKKCIGYLPEMPPLYQDMTVKEYLDFVAELKKVAKAERKKQVEEVMKKTFITDMQGRLIKNLSKGYKQRVGLAQAMIGNPDVIILDEPTVGLDPKQIIEIRELIRELKKEHTVILSSHILSEVAEVCDEIMIIAKGRLVASGSADKLLKELGSSNTIELTAKGSKKEVSEIIKSIDGVKSCTVDNAAGGCVECFISYDDNKEIRDDLCKKLVSKNIFIYRLLNNSKSLEDIFLELTDDAYVEKIEREEAAKEAEEKAKKEAEKKAKKASIA
ncbi:MAG: ABC transporter ATP-binding protein [Lachnospiraceae bacterium]|nr:ABC transporter ATP-binding protein [Lachnospiraceae bacterium]